MPAPKTTTPGHNPHPNPANPTLRPPRRDPRPWSRQSSACHHRTSEYLPFEHGYASHIWSSYGYHALINEYGIRWIVNNQYGWKSGGATHRPAAYACKSTSIGSCDDVIRMDTTQRLEIGPISYVLLTSSGG